MELTVAMLDDLLKPRYRTMHIGHYDPRKRIEDIRFSDGEFIAEKALYLTNSGEKPTHSLVLQVLEENDTPKQNGWYLFAPAGQTIRAMNDVLILFQKYLRWEAQCIKATNVDHSLDTLLECSGEFLGIHIMFVTPDFYVESMARNFFPANEETLIQPGYFPDNEVKLTYEHNPQFEETYQQRGLCHYPFYPKENGILYYFNIMYETVYLGRLLIAFPHERDGQGLRDLIEIFCKYTQDCYRYLYLRRDKKQLTYKFYDIWRELLENRPIDRESVLLIVQNIGWKIDSRYEILYLTTVGYYHSEQILKYYAVQIESMFPSCVVAQMGNGLYCLHNLDAEKSSDFRQELSVFLRENLFKAGISNSFLNLTDSYRYRLQAESALALGQECHPNLWRYAFSDYTYEYTLNQCLEQYPAKDLCPPNLALLLEYDKEHPEIELVETLYQYYACQFNGVHAAKKLCIHRTTFFYRMSKIQSIAPLHPENWEEHMQTMVALSALRKEQQNLRRYEADQVDQ